jgi:hypothetical protein
MTIFINILAFLGAPLIIIKSLRTVNFYQKIIGICFGFTFLMSVILINFNSKFNLITNAILFLFLVELAAFLLMINSKKAQQKNQIQ